MQRAEHTSENVSEFWIALRFNFPEADFWPASPAVQLIHDFRFAVVRPEFNGETTRILAKPPVLRRENFVKKKSRLSKDFSPMNPYLHRANEGMLRFHSTAPVPGVQVRY